LGCSLIDDPTLEIWRRKHPHKEGHKSSQ
jgi:hypothetical protein